MYKVFFVNHCSEAEDTFCILKKNNIIKAAFLFLNHPSHIAMLKYRNVISFARNTYPASRLSCQVLDIFLQSSFFSAVFWPSSIKELIHSTVYPTGYNEFSCQNPHCAATSLLYWMANCQLL